ncbi:hypothetical protein ACQ4M3_13300 [Leptolyngbya sp. AN03gr2]|uniref:hypothetical protein n=1 Tax=unclassified Leptolyngbya TaxID=2650499 RepID=UPI003D31EC57
MNIHSQSISPDYPSLNGSHSTQSDDARSRWIEAWLNMLVLLTISVLVLALPFSNLIHPSPWQRSLGFWHSLFASISTMVFLYMGSFAFSLLSGTIVIRRARWVSCISTFVSMLALLSGLLAFARYRAPVQDAAGVYIQVVSPLMQVGMVWHLLTTLSLFGLSISCFYCLFLYGAKLLQPQTPFLQIRWSVSLCFGWILLLGVSNFLVGLMLARVHTL